MSLQHITGDSSKYYCLYVYLAVYQKRNMAKNVKACESIHARLLQVPVLKRERRQKPK